MAVLGSRHPSDYCASMARSLARGIAASGLTVVCALDAGIAAAALDGALEATASTLGVRGAVPGVRPAAGALGVQGCGTGVRPPASTRMLHARLLRGGGVLSELPRPPGATLGRGGGRADRGGPGERGGGGRGRGHSRGPRQRVAGETLGRRVAAMPGRATSPLSTGAHALLMEGASLVRGAGDVLELASQDEGCATARTSLPEQHRHEELEPRLARIAALVGACNRDTP